MASREDTIQKAVNRIMRENGYEQVHDHCHGLVYDQKAAQLREICILLEELGLLPKEAE